MQHTLIDVSRLPCRSFRAASRSECAQVGAHPDERASWQQFTLWALPRIRGLPCNRGAGSGFSPACAMSTACMHWRGACGPVQSSTAQLQLRTGPQAPTNGLLGAHARTRQLDYCRSSFGQDRRTDVAANNLLVVSTSTPHMTAALARRSRGCECAPPPPTRKGLRLPMPLSYCGIPTDNTRTPAYSAAVQPKPNPNVRCAPCS